MATISRPLCGRAEETAILARLATSDKSEFLALYGRRRVGKTFLIRRFFQDRPSHYFEMVGRFQGSLDDQLRIFADALSTCFFHGARLATPAGWHEAFTALRTAIEARADDGRVVLFFDELPWIATHRSGCLQALEHFWNSWCSSREDILLVVCGSAASWMLRRIVNAKGGLHNRLTQSIRLLPFTLAENQDYFQSRRLAFTLRDQIELYMIFGGVPHYLEHVQRGRSVAQVVDALCLDKDGALAGEFERLFASLFEDDARYVGVVRALARKRRGLSRNELLRGLGLGSGGGVTTILENLEEGGFITATVPLGRSSRDRIYRLTDEFSLFHEKWLATRATSSWQSVRGGSRWQAWAGLAFESVCLKHAAQVKAALGISGVQASVSAWLHEEAQIDMLIDRADNVVSVVEIKFSDAPFTITRKYADELRRKLAVFRQRTKLKKAVHLVLLTCHGVTDNEYKRELVDAEVTMDALFGTG
ncbi:MAG: ATP-binding protein [Polyangiaceae bacterium]